MSPVSVSPLSVAAPQIHKFTVRVVGSSGLGVVVVVVFAVSSAGGKSGGRTDPASMMHVMEPAGRNGGGTAAGNAGTANGSAAGSTAALLTPTAAGGGLNHHHLNHHNHHHHHHHLHTHTPQLVGAGAAATALPNGGKRERGELQPLKAKKPGSSSLLMLGGLNGACAEDEVDSDLAGEDDEDDDEDGDGTAGGKRARLESLSSNGGNNSPEIDIVINNVVCSFSVRCHLNLRDIALRGINVEYRRENGVRNSSIFFYSTTYFDAMKVNRDHDDRLDCFERISHKMKEEPVGPFS